ncbi:MAG: hypothetical protein LBS88_00110 [Tannerellaceae bacterium]|jgi:hypothetical protein|nr:hypothetical protein [Tannerellaceae bacterium]
MRGYLKEIFISIAAMLLMLLAITAYFKAVREEKTNSRSDVYALVPPNAHTLLAVNRPVVFNRMILNNPSLYRMFSGEIPEVFLSIIRGNQQMSLVVFSFHAQGVICYMQAGSKTAARITKEILPEKYKPYLPQQQIENGIDFYYYPDTENRFFGYYVYNGIWVGSYSRKLLERAAVQQLNGEVLLPAGMNDRRASFDTNAPLNIICQADELGISSLEWLSADLFVSEGKICCYGSLPYDALGDSLYRSIGETLSQRITARYPRLQLSFQISREDESVYLTGCSPI